MKAAYEKEEKPESDEGEGEEEAIVAQEAAGEIDMGHENLVLEDLGWDEENPLPLSDLDMIEDPW